VLKRSLLLATPLSLLSPTHGNGIAQERSSPSSYPASLVFWSRHDRTPSVGESSPEGWPGTRPDRFRKTSQPSALRLLQELGDDVEASGGRCIGQHLGERHLNQIGLQCGSRAWQQTSDCASSSALSFSNVAKSCDAPLTIRLRSVFSIARDSGCGGSEPNFCAYPRFQPFPIDSAGYWARSGPFADDSRTIDLDAIRARLRGA
jgi:hypothetical protein